jgi:hypothetical protein
MYSFSTANIMYSALLVASVVLVRLTFVDPAPALKAGHGFWREQGKGAIAVTAGVAGMLLLPNVVAVVMRSVLNKGMSWFKNPLAPIGLYGPAALLGTSKFTSFGCSSSSDDRLWIFQRAMISQYLVGEVHEHSVFTALLLIQAFVAFSVQLANIGSAAIFFLTALPLFVVLALNPLFVG